MLTAALRKVLADTFLMYSHAHIAHWNITGPDFFQYHGFLNDLYGDLWDAIDSIAEHIRSAGGPAPASLGALLAPAQIPDRDVMATWATIRAQLLRENAVVVADLNDAFAAAIAANDQGCANFIADRLDKHAKHGWMLTVSA
jgi:starvation-inducible DNA-binding protein